MGMLRLKDNQALDDLLKAGHLTLSHDTAAKGRMVSPSAGAFSKQPGKIPHTLPVGKKGSKSAIEEMMAYQLLASALPPHVRQHHYLPDRNYKGDFMWPERKIALEVDGEVHRIKGTFSVSFQRAYLLMMAGWTVLHVGAHEVRSGEALDWITNVLARETP